jgi:hypothetical protein
MDTNPTPTRTVTSNNPFGLSNEEWDTIRAEVTAEREAKAFVENDAVIFFTRPTIVEECEE